MYRTRPGAGFPSSVALPGGPAPRTGWRATFDDYFELTKPRIIVLLLITTLAAMIMAARGIPPLELTFWTLLGGALSAASAGAINCVYDADIDAKMRRTKDRPLPRGAIAPQTRARLRARAGCRFVSLARRFVNPLAAWLSLAATRTTCSSTRCG